MKLSASTDESIPDISMIALAAEDEVLHGEYESLSSPSSSPSSAQSNSQHDEDDEDAGLVSHPDDSPLHPALTTINPQSSSSPSATVPLTDSNQSSPEVASPSSQEAFRGNARFHVIDQVVKGIFQGVRYEVTRKYTSLRHVATISSTTRTIFPSRTQEIQLRLGEYFGDVDATSIQVGVDIFYFIRILIYMYYLVVCRSWRSCCCIITISY